MRRVLLLNVTYEPLTTVGLRRAVCLVIGDKAEIVLKSFFSLRDTVEIGGQLEKLRHLRNKLAHADEYAASPAAARSVCSTVRSLISLKREMVGFVNGSKA